MLMLGVNIQKSGELINRTFSQIQIPPSDENLNDQSYE